MIATRTMPPHFLEWNDMRSAPSGRPLKLTGRLGTNRFAIRYRGPFAWQQNNGTRTFEYPWAYHEIAAHGRHLRVVEIGGGLSGLQFVLAREGHEVVNVDPGFGWALDRSQHAALCHVFRAPVRLIPTTIDRAGLPNRSADIVLCVSVLEHLTSDHLATFAEYVPRILKPDGLAILTVDLFLDVAPFSPMAANRWGRNVDVNLLLAQSGLTLWKGNRAELLGFPEFEPGAVLSQLGRYVLGTYPCVSQCFVAKPRPDGAPPMQSDERRHADCHA